MNKLVTGRLSLKILITGFIALALLIPAYMIQGVISERQQRRDLAIAETNSHWGGPLTIQGPYLSVPYTIQSNKGRQTHWTTILPENLKITADLIAEKRSRGIFNSVVYRTNITMQGTFKEHNLAAQIPATKPEWQKIRLNIGISDMQGIEKASLNMANKRLLLKPGTISSSQYTTGMHAMTYAKKSGNFRASFSIRGSSALYFAMAGVNTQITLKGNWPDPSFSGGFLPAKRIINPDGFNANWEVTTMLNRKFPTVWNSTSRKSSEYHKKLKESASGLSLLVPVDIYQKATRSVKYAGMFIVLIFLAYFLFEVLFVCQIHPIQYLFLGAAKLIFYLLLLSLSEHLGFGWAYLIAALASSVQITAYSLGILKNLQRAIWMTGILLGIYAYLYSLLQMQDYALVIGALGLFIILAAVMYLTRNVAWYKADQSTEKKRTFSEITPGSSSL